MTTSAIVPVVTNAGLAALRTAQATGLAATFANIAVGSGIANGDGTFSGYAPTATQTALKGQRAVVPIYDGQLLGSNGGSDPYGIQVEATLPATSPGSYPINELGFLLSDGTLFAVWSDPAGSLIYKNGLADVDLSFDLFLAAAQASAINVTVAQQQCPDLIGILAELTRGVVSSKTHEIQQAELLARLGILRTPEA